MKRAISLLRPNLKIITPYFLQINPTQDRIPKHRQLSKILCDKIRKRRKRTAKNTKNEGKKSRVDLKSRSGWIREREKEEYVKKHTRKLSDVISVNGESRYWKFLFSFFFSPSSFPPDKNAAGFSRRGEKGGEGEGSIRIGGRVSTFLHFLVAVRTR